MKKLLTLTVLSTMTVVLTGCECWDNFWNRGSKYSDPPAVYCPPPCPPAGCAMPVCPTSCGPVTGVQDGYVPGPGT